MHNFEALAAGYIDTWNERDPAARAAAIGKLWSDDARYTDPLMDVLLDVTSARVRHCRARSQAPAQPRRC